MRLNDKPLRPIILAQVMKIRVQEEVGPGGMLALVLEQTTESCVRHYTHPEVHQVAEAVLLQEVVEVEPH